MFKAVFMSFSPCLGIGSRGGGGYQGIDMQPASAHFNLGSSKIEVSEVYLFDIVSTQNDHPTYVKQHVTSLQSAALPFRCGLF